MRLRTLVPAVALAAALLAGCGGGDTKTVAGTTTTVPNTRVEVVEGLPEGAFDPAAIYRREAPGVVTVISVFGGTARGLGSGFVISGSGEVATNAHVVTEGQGRAAKRADEVYVQFADGNEVGAKIVGTDLDSDVALLRVKPDGLSLRPLPLGSSGRLAVGEPVAAIGSPFGEQQSLSVGVVSALDRTIESLTRFQISDAIQTDAAINRGNSGGPLLDARGRVIGINSQIRSSSGGNEGVGFAVSVDTVKRSLEQLREKGRVDYPYIGVATVPLYPQLARRLGVAASRGALVQEVVKDGPADKAEIRAGTKRIRFQGESYQAGGDVIVAVNGKPIRLESDLSATLARFQPRREVTVTIVRGRERRDVKVRLGKRP